jgi:hypothetical protein
VNEEQENRWVKRFLCFLSKVSLPQLYPLTRTTSSLFLFLDQNFDLYKTYNEPETILESALISSFSQTLTQAIKNPGILRWFGSQPSRSSELEALEKSTQEIEIDVGEFNKKLENIENSLM